MKMGREWERGYYGHGGNVERRGQRASSKMASDQPSNNNSTARKIWANYFSWPDAFRERKKTYFISGRSAPCLCTNLTKTIIIINYLFCTDSSAIDIHKLGPTARRRANSRGEKTCVDYEKWKKNVGIIANESRLLTNIGAVDSKDLSSVKLFMLRRNTCD